jgi:uncharacterized membrane protein YgdD (TMEM256/DUF423 family)
MNPTLSPSPSSSFARLAAGIAALGVLLGAFGAHGLQETFARVGAKAEGWWETAVFYHLVHAIALYAIAVGASFRRGPWICMALGILVFSGTLYAMALTGMTKLGAVTPIGGILMVAGWLWLAIRK